MYPAQRREALLQLLAKEGFVSIHDLALQFDVSEITIRRDLKVLSQQGRVKKVAGGGQLMRNAEEPTFLKKHFLQQAEKEQIAQRALTMIEPGMTVGLSAGTTTWTLAQRLRADIGNLTFVTNSTNVAIALKSNGWNEIYLTGGHFRTPSDALVGPLAEESARRLRTDIFFLGVHGVDLENGVTSPNLQEASINRVLMERTDSVTLLFDHTKWGIRAFAHLAEFEEIDVVITDIADKETEIEQLRRFGPEVFTV